MANLALLGSPRRGGSSNTFAIDTMCEEGLIASITAPTKIAAGGSAPHAVTAGRKGEAITGYTSGREVPVQLDAGVSSITIGQTVYVVSADGKAHNASAGGRVATRAVFVSAVISETGATRNIAGSESDTKKWALISFEGGL